ALATRSRPTLLVREVALERPSLTFGRSPSADVVLDSPIVSQLHARLVRDKSGLQLEDLGSSNGTYLGEARIDRAPLEAGAHIVIGPFLLELAAQTLRIHDTRSRSRLDARGLRVDAGTRTILEDVSLSLAPGSFTAFIGPSGAGKSTLLSVLAGARPAQQGEGRLNGANLHRSFEALKATLGLVPQAAIVHRELTAGESLAHTARL